MIFNWCGTLTLTMSQAAAPRHAAPRGPIREPEARHGGDDHVEGIRGIAPMDSRIGQEWDQRKRLDEGTRPAVHDEEGPRGEWVSVGDVVPTRTDTGSQGPVSPYLKKSQALP